MATWPSTLPKPTRDGYTLEPVDPNLRTDMEAGPSRFRRRFTATPTDNKVRFRFTRLQFEIFEAWWTHEISDGALWFTMPIYNGKGEGTTEAHFVGTWKADFAGPNSVSVTAALEWRTRPIMTAAELAPYL